MKTHTIILIAVVVVIVAAIISLTYVPTQQQASRGLGVVSPPEVENGAGLQVGNNIGQIAPDFILEDAQGNRLRLSDFRGQVVFLNFWASWCPFCIDEMPDIQEVSDEFGEDVVAIFVNRGERIQTGQNYIDATLGGVITDPVVYDPSEDVYRAYSAGNFMPVSYVIDENGVVRDMKFGPITKDEIVLKLQNVLQS